MFTLQVPGPGALLLMYRLLLTALTLLCKQQRAVGGGAAMTHAGRASNYSAGVNLARTDIDGSFCFPPYTVRLSCEFVPRCSFIKRRS